MKTESIKNYSECLEYMYAHLPMYQRQGLAAYKKDLNNTIALCKVLGNPQDNFKTIHVAGTNGKGSTTHIIAAGLQAQGYKVGVYTSPHYIDFRERIKINGIFISKKHIKDFINIYRNELETVCPSFFEMTVALAFGYFKDQKVDYAIIETGLGGRLDSTNVIKPIVSVITNISFDHQNLLGDTLLEIAGEKAGIIKSFTPVIIGEKQKSIQHVFINKAKELHSKLIFAEEYIQMYDMDSENLGYSNYQIKHENNIWINNLQTDLIGPFQKRNLTTGLATLLFLSDDIKISPQNIIDFFPTLKEKTKFIGRWQIMSTCPLIIADSAHNEAGLDIVLNEIQEKKYNRLHIVMGFVNDKDLDKILILFPKNAHYYFVKANIPRGLESTKLKEKGEVFGLQGKAYSSIRKGFAAAKKMANTNDIIFVGGSIFVVAEVI